MVEAQPQKLERHPLSALWPDMPEDQYREFVAGIEKRHIRQVIMTLDGKILDGWHRYKACLELGIEPFVAEYTESDPVGYVIRQNAMRRHLTPGQRAACIDACYQWRDGGMQPGQGRDEDGRFTGGAPGSPPVPTVEDIAAEAGVSERTVQQVRSAERVGLGEAVRSGELSPKAAAAQARGDPKLPKGPTPKECMEAQVDALALDLQEKAQHIDDLEDQVRFHQGNMSEHEHERYKAFTAMQSENRTLRSQVNEWMTKHNEELRSRRYWERWAKEHGWTVGEVKP